MSKVDTVNNSVEEIILLNRNTGPPRFGMWTAISILKAEEMGPLYRSHTSGNRSPLYYTEHASSTMDLAFLIAARGEFPPWASVLAGQQTRGRGQFQRDWISPHGNLYASIHLPEPGGPFPTLPGMVMALSVQKTLTGLGLFAEFKWPNDILVNRKKVGGILIEEREGVTVTGVGINLIHAPSPGELRDPRALTPGHLKEFGVSIEPLELWQSIQESVIDHFDRFQGATSSALIRSLEKSLAFMGETVVVTSPDGDEFPAQVEGLSESGAIRLKTQEGEKILFSGTLFPVVC
jgi:BirA family biotin operon repressor/biotin-[acetyl-CoA-carboxylase] ligase